mgnify:CR=1 FL=1
MIALKLSWIRRLIISQSNWTNLFESQFGYILQTIISLGIDFIDILIKKATNTFWINVLLIRKTMYGASKDTDSYNEMFYEHLWFNPEIKINKKSELFKDLFEQSVRYITNIYENSNELLSYTGLNNRVRSRKGCRDMYNTLILKKKRIQPRKSNVWWHTSAPTCKINYVDMQRNYVNMHIINFCQKYFFLRVNFLTNAMI